MIPRRSVIAGMLAVVVLQGCGSDGMTEISIGDLTVRIPKDWKKMNSTGGKWNMGFSDGQTEIQICGHWSEGTDPGIVEAELSFIAEQRVSNFKLKMPSDVKIKGAARAGKYPFTYAGEDGPMEGVWISAGRWPHPVIVAIAISGHKLDPLLVEKIIEGMEVHEAQK